MSILLIKSSPCSLRSGIIAPRGLGCLYGKAVQLSDTFSGHACCDGVPKTLVWERKTNNEEKLKNIVFKKKKKGKRTRIALQLTGKFCRADHLR